MEKDAMKQNRQVYEHIKTMGSITTMEAFTLYGITRLSARIFDLKNKGVEVKKEMETGYNRYSEPVRYARYYL